MAACQNARIGRSRLYEGDAFRGFDLDLPEGSVVYADKQYNDYHYEDLLKEAASVEMKPLRKRNSKRPFAVCVEYVQKWRRKRIETSFSQIVEMMPRRIHAVRAKGFELKIVCFILAFAVQFLWGATWVRSPT